MVWIIIEYILDTDNKEVNQNELENVLKLRRATVSGVLQTMEKTTNDSYDREHVTPYIYNNLLESCSRELLVLVQPILFVFLLSTCIEKYSIP